MLNSSMARGRSICIVTEELAGVTRSGGIGACSRGLALHLMEAGYDVEVVVTDLTYPQAAGNKKLPGVRLVYLSEIARRDPEIEMPVDHVSKAYVVYRYLRRNDFALVHFHDYLGLGYYTATAKRQQLLHCVIVTHTHGSCRWVRRHNLNRPSLEDLETETLEQHQIELSDLVVSPSQYLLDWYRAEGMALPNAIRLDWMLPQWIESEQTPAALGTPPVPPGSIDHLIFFGRQERRKGVEVFVDALRALPEDTQPSVTFLGRFDRLYGEFTGSYVFRRLQNYRGAIRFVNDLGPASAMDFIRSRPNALCVMPSLIENSPCTVGECFTLGVPFLATDVGGTPELTVPEDRHDPPLQANWRSLSAHLTRVLRDGMPAVRSTLKPADICERWTALHERLLKPDTAPQPAPRRPLVSVCLVHFERPLLLKRALAALNAQTYDAFEVIISDDGSKSPEAVAALAEIENEKSYKFPLTVLRGENCYLGAARNAAARLARGEYLLFHDDDNVAEPREIEQFVASALASGSDILTSQCYIFEGEPGGAKRILYYPMGVGGIFSFYRNRFGDANALFRKATFDALGGFTEHYGIGWEDWELFLKAHLRGFHLTIVPEALFWYRASPGGMLATGNPVLNQERFYTMVTEVKLELHQDLLRHAQGEALSRQEYDLTRLRLGLLPHGATHVALMNDDPNGLDARLKLIDIALSVHRHDDARALADRTSVTRLHPVYKATHLDRSHAAAAIPEFAFEEPAAGALLLNGWWSDSTLEALEAVELEGQRHAVLGALRYSRQDVSDFLKAPRHVDLGFILLVAPAARTLALLNRLRTHAASLGVASSLGVKHAVFVLKRGACKDARGHIDAIEPLRRANRLALTDTVTIDVIAQNSINAVFLEGAQLITPDTSASAHYKRFRCGPGAFDLFVSSNASSPALVGY